MNRIGEHQKVKDFLNQVCAPIKATEIHNEIKRELENHLDEIVEAKINEKIEMEEAIKQAILQMGDPKLLGKQLHEVHKPKVEWSLLGLIGAFIGIGLMAMYAVQLSDNTITNKLFASQTMRVGLGLLVMILFNFFDYRRMKSFSWPIYCVAALGTAGVILYKKVLNQDHWTAISEYAEVTTITPYLFLIALAGILTSNDWKRTSIAAKVVFFILVPSILYQINYDYNSLIIYTVGFLVLTFTNKKNWTEFSSYLASYATLFVVGISYMPQYIIKRFAIIFGLSDEPLGSGNITLQTKEALSSAGIWGHGFGANIDTTAEVPLIWTDYVFTYLVYSLGWLMGTVILLAITLLLLRIGGAVKKLADPYGKRLVIGLSIILAVSFFLHILKSVGLHPGAGVPFPFISYGGTHLLFEFAAVGFILSVYRRKDMIKHIPFEPIDEKT